MQQVLHLLSSECKVLRQLCIHNGDPPNLLRNYIPCGWKIEREWILLVRDCAKSSLFITLLVKASFQKCVQYVTYNATSPSLGRQISLHFP
jgi:hypothetical protein